MSVNFIDPFIESVCGVMPQLGFCSVQPGEPTVISNKVVDTGVIIVVGIVGDVKGNIAYKMDFESAFKIASTMMMCDPLSELDDIAQSALGELTNMLTANAATEFSKIGIRADISTPTMLQGNNITLKMSTDSITCIRFSVDDVHVDINISLEKQ
jgi:chemotaxis protein CheX